MKSLQAALRVPRKHVDDRPLNESSLSRSSAFSISVWKVLSRTPTTEKLVDRAIENSSIMLDTAIDLIAQNTTASDIVLKLFFRDNSPAWRQKLVSKLKLISQYTKHLKRAKNIKVIKNAKSQMGAEIDMRTSAALRRYLEYKNNMSDFLGEKQRSQLLKQKREELKELLDSPFMTINSVNFNNSKKDDFLSAILIHEISHAAIDTMDFMYVHASAPPPLDTEAVQGEPSPLFRLARGLITNNLALEPTLSPSQHNLVFQCLSGDKAGFSALAKNNADSIAYAVRELYSSSRSGESLRYYERTVGRAAMQFASSEKQ